MYHSAVNAMHIIALSMFSLISLSKAESDAILVTGILFCYSFCLFFYFMACEMIYFFYHLNSINNGELIFLYTEYKFSLIEYEITFSLTNDASFSK